MVFFSPLPGSLNPFRRSIMSVNPSAPPSHYCINYCIICIPHSHCWTFTVKSDGPYKISRYDWYLAFYHASSETILRVLRLFQHAAHCVLLMNGKLFLFININFRIFLCQSPRRPAQVFSELHGGRAEAGCGRNRKFP